MLKRILHIIFSFLVLFGSTGYTLHSHYCGGELQETSIIKKISSCCPADENGKNDCCKNETELQQIEDDFIGVSSLELTPVLTSFFIIPRYLTSLSEQNIIFPEYYNYRPPLLDIDIPVDLQTFLC